MAFETLGMLLAPSPLPLRSVLDFALTKFAG